MVRSFFIGLSESEAARNFVTHFGPARQTALRFVAGETLDEAANVVKDLNAKGIRAIINEVGESVTTQAEATEAAHVFFDIAQRIDNDGLDATISVKPSHIGLSFGRDFLYENLADIVNEAHQRGVTVEVDMEGSDDIDTTLAVFHQLMDTFDVKKLRLAVQTYLYRTPDDLEPIIAQGGSARLVKGAYSEPSSIAMQTQEEIRAATKECARMFLTDEARKAGAYLALGSHDPVLIEWLIEETQERGIPKEDFEFQMLLGVRRDEQERLASEGYKMRTYVPYGSAWYPYFMRRLAERPANVMFMARAIVGG